VTNVVVIASDPKGPFDAAARSAVERWKYRPMIKEGRAVERRGMQVLLRFNMDK